MSCVLPSLHTSTMMKDVCRISETLAVTTVQLIAWEDFVVCKNNVSLDFTDRQQNVTELLRKLPHDWILTLRINSFYTYSNDCIITYLLACLLTYSTEQSPSWEANRLLDSQELPRIWWKRMVHYLSHKSPTCPYPESARSSPYPTSHFLKIHLNIILPSTPGSPHWSLSLRFPHQNPV